MQGRRFSTEYRENFAKLEGAHPQTDRSHQHHAANKVTGRLPGDSWSSGVSHLIEKLDEYVQRSQLRIIDIVRRGDRSADGTLSLSEFHTVLSKIGISVDHADVADMVALIDVNHDEQVEPRELQKLLRSYRLGIKQRKRKEWQDTAMDNLLTNIRSALRRKGQKEKVNLTYLLRLIFNHVDKEGAR